MVARERLIQADENNFAGWNGDGARKIANLLLAMIVSAIPLLRGGVIIRILVAILIGPGLRILRNIVARDHTALILRCRRVLFLVVLRLCLRLLLIA